MPEADPKRCPRSRAASVLPTPLGRGTGVRPSGRAGPGRGEGEPQPPRRRARSPRPARARAREAASSARAGCRSRRRGLRHEVEGQAALLREDPGHDHRRDERPRRRRPPSRPAGSACAAAAASEPRVRGGGSSRSIAFSGSLRSGSNRTDRSTAAARASSGSATPWWRSSPDAAPGGSPASRPGPAPRPPFRSALEAGVQLDEAAVLLDRHGADAAQLPGRAAAPSSQAAEHGACSSSMKRMISGCARASAITP